MGLKPKMETIQLKDLYTSGNFKTKAELEILNQGKILPQSYNSFMRIIKDLIGEGKKYQGAPLMIVNTKKHSVSTIGALMAKVKKGSGEYRKIIASRRMDRDIHNPTNWREKLCDDSITSYQVKTAMKVMHSKYLSPNVRNRLGDLCHNKTKFGAGLEAANLTQEDWCKTCCR